MNRNDRKIEALARKRKWKSKDVPNKLHQIKQETVVKKKPKTNPNGRTVIMKNNEII